MKKIGRYLSNMADLEDILLMEWFLNNAGVEVGLDWKEMFWAIEQLGKRRENRGSTQ